MRKKRSAPDRLTELELEVMNCVWHRGEPWTDVETIGEGLREGGRELAGPSVRTMLGILVEKGYLERAQEGRRSIYRALVPREEAQANLVGRVVEQAFGGSATSLVAALLRTEALHPGDLDEVRRLLGEAERAERSPKLI